MAKPVSQVVEVTSSSRRAAASPAERISSHHLTFDRVGYRTSAMQPQLGRRTICWRSTLACPLLCQVSPQDGVGSSARWVSTGPAISHLHLTEFATDATGGRLLLAASCGASTKTAGSLSSHIPVFFHDIGSRPEMIQFHPDRDWGLCATMMQIARV